MITVTLTKSETGALLDLIQRYRDATPYPQELGNAERVINDAADVLHRAEQVDR